jgi:hypothetical protein
VLLAWFNLHSNISLRGEKSNISPPTDNKVCHYIYGENSRFALVKMEKNEKKAEKGTGFLPPKWALKAPCQPSICWIL